MKLSGSQLYNLSLITWNISKLEPITFITLELIILDHGLNIMLISHYLDHGLVFCGSILCRIPVTVILAMAAVSYTINRF